MFFLFIGLFYSFLLQTTYVIPTPVYMVGVAIQRKIRKEAGNLSVLARKGSKEINAKVLKKIIS